jgi:hypothetical protein
MPSSIKVDPRNSFQFRCVVVPFSGELRRHFCAPFSPKPPPFDSRHHPLAQLAKIHTVALPVRSPSTSKVATSKCSSFQCKCRSSVHSVKFQLSVAYTIPWTKLVCAQISYTSPLALPLSRIGRQPVFDSRRRRHKPTFLHPSTQALTCRVDPPVFDSS